MQMDATHIYLFYNSNPLFAKVTHLGVKIWTYYNIGFEITSGGATRSPDGSFWILTGYSGDFMKLDDATGAPLAYGKFNQT